VTRRLVEALHRRAVDRTPVWIMRQAGRYLPEYRELRQRQSFQEAVSTPSVAAEITLQPIRRFGMDGAVIFADIMTPLEGMGVDMTFDPGPRLRPHTLAEVISLEPLYPARVEFVAETVRGVVASVPEDTAVIGFAGAPFTLLAYLVEGGGSKEFMELRAAITADPVAAAQALQSLARSMNSYLAMQVEAGAHVVQLFDTWAGLLGRDAYARTCVDPNRQSLAGLESPSIYFAPGAGHTLDMQSEIGAAGYGVDWRIPIDEAWERLGPDVAVQGNVDPAVLRADPTVITAAVDDVKRRVGSRLGHILNLGHGIDRHTPVEHVAAFVEAARS
jgi:uroporphyrinogen decarboxylase